MKAYQALWRLIRLHWPLYLANAFLWSSINLVELLPGLAVKLFFDMLTGEAPTGFDEWGIAALFVMSAVVNIGAILGGTLTDARYRFHIGTLLGSNILKGILDRPEARASLISPGEVINGFRDDIQVVEEAASWFIDQISAVIYAAVALAIMLSISAPIALWVVLPLVGVILLMRIAQSRIAGYRQASRQATARVSGALGETFGAIQAIQIAGAESHVLAHIRKLSDRRQQLMIKDHLLTQMLNSLSSHAGTLVTGLVLILAAQTMRTTSTFSVGDLALLSPI